MWLSLVERLLWEQDAAGSNPVIRTNTGIPNWVSRYFYFPDVSLCETQNL